MRDSACRAEPLAGAAAPAPAPLPDSVVKRRKLGEFTRFLGDTTGLRCLDLGADNGVLSYLLRQRGGTWTSADLDEEAVSSIRQLVGDPVYRLDGGATPFHTDEFDRVVIVDFLEHVHDDRSFIAELFRIVKSGGEVIINVPHAKGGVLRWLRLALGDTDDKHGHARPGYTSATLHTLLDGRFQVVAERTYSKAFSELLDIGTRVAMARLKRGEETAAKGVFLVSRDFERHRRLFGFYALIRPLLGLFAMLDGLLIWSAGHMLIVKAHSLKSQSVVANASLRAPSEERT